MPTVLIIEWDATQQRQIADIVKSAGLIAKPIDNHATALDIIRQSHEIDFALYSECEQEGAFADFMESLEASAPSLPVLFLAKSHASAQTALERGAADCLIQPLSVEQLRIALTRLSRWSHAQKLAAGVGTRSCSAAASTWIGQSQAMEQLKQTVRKLARTQATILIQGDAGSGKSHTAYQLHQQSPQTNGPFLTVDASQGNVSDIHQQLFGIPGRTEPSLIELAQGGTLLIEDVDLLPMTTQGALLHLIETRSFQRHGLDQSIPSQVRILATTRVDLAAQVAAGTFREDLSIALGLFPVRVPSLADRTSDIPLLAEYFIRQLSGKYRRQVVALSQEALKVLENQPWTGNLRELESTIFQAVLRKPAGAILEIEHLITSSAESASRETHQEAVEPEVDDLATLEKLHIFRVLKKCGENRTHAARRLGCSIRTLRNKLREYRLAAQAEQQNSLSSTTQGDTPGSPAEETDIPFSPTPLAHPTVSKDSPIAA